MKKAPVLDSYLAEFPREAPVTAQESVARTLRRLILNGALAGGSVLRQEELSKKLGVSRMPLREALLKLEGEGLVETQPRRGVVVTMLSAQDFEEILEMRYSLESLAIEGAAKRFTAEDTQAALEIVERAEAEIKLSAAPDLDREFESRWGDLNWEFHRRLYHAADKPRLLSTIENLHQLFARHLRVRIATSPGKDNPAFGSREEQIAKNLQEWQEVLAEHREMVMACDRHDAPAAQAVLKRHISDHGAELMRRLREAAQP